MATRLKYEDGREQVFHCMSRINGRLFLLGEAQREQMRRMLWKVAGFAGVEVLTYAVLSNHFHVLVLVPEGAPGPVADGELLRRIGLLHPRARVGEVRRVLEGEDREEAARERAKWLGMMGEVSKFMKLFKQRYAIWHNRTTGREGTLWDGRYRSVLVESAGGGRALRMVAGYIDLNAVRAGLARDPAQYRWCGYGEAEAGSGPARAGLCRVLGLEAGQWREARDWYRGLIGEVLGPREEGGAKSGGGGRAGGGPEVAALARRVRHFTEGLALGSRAFVDQVFAEHRGQFGPRRRTGARRMRGVPWPDVMAARDLRRDVPVA